MTGQDTTYQMLTGMVIHGRQLGRRLGYPTANIDTHSLTTVLPSGVYAGWAVLNNGCEYPAMVNVGYRPTVDTEEHKLSVEAHLHGYTGDLYGEILNIKLVSRIRDERKMDSLDELKAQLGLDLLQTLERLNVTIQASGTNP